MPVPGFETVTINQLFEKSGEVEARSSRWAAVEAFKRSVSKTSFLNDHVTDNVITQEQLDIIRSAEETIAADLALSERRQGLHNDPKSEKIGFIALFSNSSRARFLLESLGERTANATGYVVRIDNIDILWGLNAPEGVFAEDPHESSTDMLLWTGAMHDCDGNPSYRQDNSDATQFFSSDLVRIEGYSGELWQNRQYTPTGARSGYLPSAVDIA